MAADSTPLRLADDEVHVWFVDLDPGPAADVARALSTDERERAQRLCFERDRRRFVARRAARRSLLARYTGTAPERLRFATGPHGKPALVGGDIHFSTSHARGLGVVAVTRGREVGIDVERIRRLGDAGAIALALFPRGAAAPAGVDPAAQLDAFFVSWTRIEAYVKATGEGLGGARRAPVPDARWSLRTLRPQAGWVAAVAAEGSGWRLRCRWW
jgi:4'-phosphopantetheinyl transferase